jgi:hypothetical protein
MLRQGCGVERTGCNKENKNSGLSHAARLSVIVSSRDDFFGAWFEQDGL